MLLSIPLARGSVYCRIVIRLDMLQNAPFRGVFNLVFRSQVVELHGPKSIALLL